MATQQAFKKGIMEAKPVLLEPIATLKVVVPEGYTGDVMGELNKSCLLYTSILKRLQVSHFVVRC